MSDVRPWIASIVEDEEGDRTLVMSYTVLAHQEDNERVVVENLLAERLLVPLVDEEGRTLTQQV